MFKLFFAIALAFTFTAACNKTEPAPPVNSTASTSEAEPAHAPPGAKPGSYEDWCGAHKVPESLCTRCNAKLIPAFKATGDWCAEHGLPESQCKVCNPELKIERPPKVAP